MICVQLITLAASGLRRLPSDNVRLSSIRSTFDKSSTANWTEEIFKVKTVKNTKPNVYKLVDLNDESVEGIFYDFELQKVPVDVTEKFFKIESIIKKKKVAARWYYFVKYVWVMTIHLMIGLQK